VSVRVSGCSRRMVSSRWRFVFTRGPRRPVDWRMLSGSWPLHNISSIWTVNTTRSVGSSAFHVLVCVHSDSSASPSIPQFLLSGKVMESEGKWRRSGKSWGILKAQPCFVKIFWVSILFSCSWSKFCANWSSFRWMILCLWKNVYEALCSLRWFKLLLYTYAPTVCFLVSLVKKLVWKNCSFYQGE